MEASGLRNRALLIGAGWTLAVAAALVWFKSVFPEPIYLWSSGIVALGWAVVVLQALSGVRHTAGGVIVATRSETLAVIDSLTRATSDEVDGACKELERVDELLGHAIEQLTVAFHSMSAHVSIHQDEELARQISEVLDATVRARLQAVAEGLEHDINGVVMALQFRDVVGQKLQHVRRELEALGQAMQRIRDLSSGQSGLVLASEWPEISKPTDLSATVRGLLQELQEARAASPVRQKVMDAGEVELF